MRRSYYGADLTKMNSSLIEIPRLQIENVRKPYVIRIVSSTSVETESAPCLFVCTSWHETITTFPCN